MRTVKTSSGATAVKTARRYRIIQTKVGDHIIAAEPRPDDLRAGLTKISHAGRGAH